jgi:hypothetical protein
MTDVRRGIDLARGELESVSIDGETYWIAGDPAPRPRASAHLLPNYDEFFIGYRDRSAIGNRLKSVKAVTGGNALIAHVIAVDGQLVGGWRKSPAKEAVRLNLQLLTRLTAAEEKRTLDEVRRFAAFAGKPVDLQGLGKQRSVRIV